VITPWSQLGVHRREPVMAALVPEDSYPITSRPTNMVSCTDFRPLSTYCPSGVICFFNLPVSMPSRRISFVSLPNLYPRLPHTVTLFGDFPSSSSDPPSPLSRRQSIVTPAFINKLSIPLTQRYLPRVATCPRRTRILPMGASPPRQRPRPASHPHLFWLPH